ncbi:MAG TPA: FxLYD domain-containing protein [Candidatus Dormibacteraeota bacterium]|nr:FxLYD domain-containing protein [Candidatus Dormibacteraeota bacterium]
MEQEDKSRLVVSFAVGLVIVLLIFGGFYLAMRFSSESKPVTEQPLAFGAAEQAYVANVDFENLEMSAFENMLHQKVTYLNGDISNKGRRAIRAADVTIEFYDPEHKLLLREVRRIVGNGTRPLQSGETRDFQIGFETLPADWDHKFPAIHVTGLDLE